MWGRRAECRVIRWDARGGGAVAAEHDGYARLQDPTIHRRSYELDEAKGCLCLTDEILAAGQHRVTVGFHLDGGCSVIREQGNRLRIVIPEGTIHLDVDPGLSLTVAKGGEASTHGWRSRAYHDREPAWSIQAEAFIHAGSVFEHRIWFAGAISVS
jgi:hypothetical protein